MLLPSVLPFLAFCALVDALKQPVCTTTTTTTVLRCVCTGWQVRTVPQDLNPAITHLTLQHTALQSLEAEAFVRYPHLIEVHIENGSRLSAVDWAAFGPLRSLRKLRINGCPKLKRIDGQPSLRANGLTLLALNLANNGLEEVPRLLAGRGTAARLLDLSNNFIRALPNDGRLAGLDFAALLLSNNLLTTVGEDALRGCRIHFLAIDRNPLVDIHPGAFSGITVLRQLDLSYTRIGQLPVVGLRDLQALSLKGTYTLKVFAPAVVYAKLRFVHLTYPHHCCYFWKFANGSSRVGGGGRRGRRRRQQVGRVVCQPEPDALNPCEDMAGHSLVRLLMWLEWMLSVAGNVAVLACSIGRLGGFKSVARFLISNLAFADLCTGLFLALLAVQDVRTAGNYFNYAVDWQTGPGCSTAGFFAVFASQLSVVTLVAISFQLWYDTRAAFYGFRFQLRRAVLLQTAGWVFSLALATLPLLDLNNYSVTSVCLPLRSQSASDRGYLLFILLFNLVAFAYVAFNYVHIYFMVSGGNLPSARTQDWSMARKMSLLIFANAACWLPSIVLGVSAVVGRPLVGISSSKFLLVLAYPINATADPFLYALSCSAIGQRLRHWLSKLSWRRLRYNRLQKISQQSVNSSSSIASACFNGSATRK